MYIYFYLFVRFTAIHNVTIIIMLIIIIIEIVVVITIH